MSEHAQPDSIAYDQWRQHYNDVSGPAKIEARQHVYWLANDEDESGEPAPRIDLEVETIQALGHIGLSESATVVDIGCSFPNFLELWRLQGHRGRLIGVEPNTKQFDSLPYWQPNVSGELYQPPSDLNRPADHYDIELVEAWADSLPLATNEADAATMMLMMYHVPDNLQLRALKEAKRIIEPEQGVFALTTRGKQNKQVLRRVEEAISKELTRSQGDIILPPPPVNSGFMSHHAANVLPWLYKHVYSYTHRAELIMDSPASAGIVDRAIWTLRDKYIDSKGAAPSEAQFEQAIGRVLGGHFLTALQGKVALRDKMEESLFIAADRPLDLPDKFVKL